MEDHTPNALQRLMTWVRDWRKGPQSSAPVLLPLTPKYDPVRHGIYFDVIESALTDSKREVRNIALTGSYGVGKSSILTEVARRHKRDVIAVSLSTLGFPEEEPVPAGDIAKAASTKTNRIQKEIVKQLLYSQDPLKTPGSRYRRTTRFHFWRSLWLSTLLSLPVTVVFFLTGWIASIASLIPATKDIWWLGHLVVFGASTLLLLGLFAAFHNRFQIEKLGTSAATISLSAKSSTYFDEYLDEIVYFFEVIRRDIVIFEDIDRFDDPHIFETLRSLNSILNSAKQLKGRKVRFIYAIKDSIFDELGSRAAKEELSGNDPKSLTEAEKKQKDAADAEVARANRTKFFDLVIPVVPFITHRSARDLLVQTLGDDLEHAVPDELIDLTARYVADMRLIKNIRNEYAIFKRQVIDSGNLDLREDALFAMVLYKSTHLSDFELIKLGKSSLDELYRDGRQLVADNLKILNATVRTSRLRRLRITTSADRAVRLADALNAYLATAFGHFPQMTIQDMHFEGKVVDETRLKTPEFWDTMASEDGILRVVYYDNQVGNRAAHFSKADIEHAVGEKLNSAAWADAERQRLDEAISKAVEARDFLAHADMTDLIKRSEFKLKVNEEESSFEELAKKHLKSELALRLLDAGCIDRNFTLYTSTFYTDRVSANATNYILKNVDPNVIDMHFSLKPDDVAAILRERGRTILGEKSAYNVSVLDYLAQRDPDGLNLLLSRLLNLGDEERDFLLVYLDAGAETTKVIAAVARRWPSVFTFLVSEAGLDAGAQLNLIDVALGTASANTAYETDDALSIFLADNYGSLTVFTSDETSSNVAARAAELVESAEVELSSLAGIAPTVKSAIVERGSYVVTRDNLLLALNDGEHSLTLDSIRQSDENVYRRVLTDLAGYMAALTENQPTVAQPDEFASILEDVLDEDEQSLAAVVERSVVECVIAELSEVAIGAWAVLANYSRFPVAFVNVKAYVDELGLDERLARMLETAGAIDTPDDSDEAARTALGLTILGAKDQVASAKLRAQLVGSLRLKSYLDAGSVPVERGELLGWLIVEGIVQDEAATFAAVAAGDTDGLAFAISKSEDFASFMTTTEVTPANVGPLIDHAQVPSVVKEAILSRFTEMTSGTSRAGLTMIAHYCVISGKSLTFDEVSRLAREGVEASLVLSLLERHLPAIGIAELAPVLVGLGGDYATLSARNGKHPRISITQANRALVERLKELGIANTASEVRGEIKVNLKQG